MNLLMRKLFSTWNILLLVVCLGQWRKYTCLAGDTLSQSQSKSGGSWNSHSVLKAYLPKLVDIFPWTYLWDWLKWNLHFFNVWPIAASFLCWTVETFSRFLPNLVISFSWINLTDLPKWNMRFVVWSDILYRFQEILTKLLENLSLTYLTD